MFIDLSKASKKYRKQAAVILFEASKTITLDSWTTIKSAEKEVKECCNKKFISCGLVENNELIGWVGLRPMYNYTWELHPLMVKQAHQGKGIGSKLLDEVESIAKGKNILNIILGTDDELGQTSLSGKDLYKSDLFNEIKNISNLNNHPFEFYQKNGYRIVGVIPDASGKGKPDIIMGKRIG